MAENEENTVTPDPIPDTEAAGEDPRLETTPEPEPEPEPGVVDEGTVIVHGRGGRKRVSMSEYRAMKEADGA